MAKMNSLAIELLNEAKDYCACGKECGEEVLELNGGVCDECR